MRVLQVHTHYRDRGGEDAVADTELRLLRQAGHEVLPWRTANPAGPRAITSFASAPWNAAAAKRLGLVASSFRPDIAHVHNTWYASSPAVIATLHELAIPVVMTLHNYRLICAAATLYRDGTPCQKCVGRQPWHAVQHRCYRNSAPASLVAAGTIALHERRGTWRRDVSRYIALTEFGRQQFIDGGLPAEQIVVKSNSVEDPGPRAEPPSSSRDILFVGRLSDEKGIRLLLDSWPDDLDDLRLVVIGSGPLETALHQSASPSVTFLGELPHEEVLSLLMTARALVLPSTWYEGQPLAVLEAAAAGLPVILSDLGAMPELLAPGAGPVLFPPGDGVALRDRLRSLRDGKFVDRYGEVNRDRFRTRFTHKIATERLEEIYRSAQVTH